MLLLLLGIVEQGRKRGIEAAAPLAVGAGEVFAGTLRIRE